MPCQYFPFGQVEDFSQPGSISPELPAEESGKPSLPQIRSDWVWHCDQHTIKDSREWNEECLHHPLPLQSKADCVACCWLPSATDRCRLAVNWVPCMGCIRSSSLCTTRRTWHSRSKWYSSSISMVQTLELCRCKTDFLRALICVLSSCLLPASMWLLVL